MPTRRHLRTGARDGQLSDDLQDALLREAHTFGAFGGAVDRIRAVGDFFAQVDAELEQFSDVRFDAIAELRSQGWSYGRIAEAVGLSESRVAQLSRSARVGGRAVIPRTRDE